MSDQTQNYPTACSHVSVERLCIEKDGRVFEQQWRCKDCGARFVCLDGLFAGPQQIQVMEPVRTLRDEFAIALMPTLIGRASEYDRSYSSIILNGSNAPTAEELEALAENSKETRRLMVAEAYKWADTMLEVRK